jgi:hypothetical protein
MYEMSRKSMPDYHTLLPLPGHDVRMLVGNCGDHVDSHGSYADDDDRANGAYSISVQRGKYHPLVKISRQVEGAWTRTIEAWNRLDGTDPELSRSREDLAQNVNSFFEVLGTCLRSGARCSVHDTRSTNRCVSKIEADAKVLIEVMRRLRANEDKSATSTVAQ